MPYFRASYDAAAATLRIEGCARPGAEVFADQLNASGPADQKQGRTAALRVSGFERTALQFRALQGSGNGGAWVEVLGSGGNRSAPDVGTAVTVFTGATGEDYAIPFVNAFVLETPEIARAMAARAHERIAKDEGGALEGIPLGEVTTSMTINSTASILLALYQAVAEKQGVAAADLQGTIQNDILKEYAARGTYVYPPRPSIRIITDIFAFCGITGDFNPIHVDEQYAKQTRWQGRIAHGLLVASMVTQTLSSLLGEGAVHVSQEVAFVAPVHIGDSITVVSEVVEKIDDKRRVVVSTVWTKQDGTTVITGKGEVLIPRDKTGCKE